MNPTSSSSKNLSNLNPTSQQHHQINIQTTPSHDQPPLPLNLPRSDLLIGREDYNEILVPSYKATITGDWKAAKTILARRPELLRFSITESCETVLHIAVLEKSYWFVEYLVSLMEKEDLELQNVNGQTALSLAAMTGHVKMAKILVKKNQALLDIPDSRGMMPLYMAALYGKHEMVKYLYHKSKKMTGDFWTHENRVCVLVKSVESNLFDGFGYKMQAWVLVQYTTQHSHIRSTHCNSSLSVTAYPSPFRSLFRQVFQIRPYAVLSRCTLGTDEESV